MSTILAFALVSMTGALEVGELTATSKPTGATLVWTNPIDTVGTVVVRATSAVPNTAPSNGSTYSVGATLGNGTVRYVGSAATFTDSGLTNGTRYYYRVFNRALFNVYSAGQVPTSNGISVVPTDQVSPNPYWCYATGLSLTQQPVVDPNAGVMTAGNSGRMLSLDLTGAERFRPLALVAAIGSRMSSVPLVNRSGRYGIMGDQSGLLYGVNLSTGTIALSGNGGLTLGDALIATVGTQLYAYANAAFQAANANRDLIFVPTRNLLATSNRVVALSSANGSIVWTYAPGDMDVVNGGVLVDYVKNQVWVAGRSNGNTQASLRVINSLTGAEVQRASLGDIDTGVVKDFGSNQAFVINSSGTAYGYNLSTGTQVWSANVGAVSSYLYPTGTGFIASLSSGSVQRWSVSGGTASLVWSASVPGPSGVTIDYANQTLYVGASDGSLRKIALATGTQTGSYAISTAAVGMPTIDVAGSRLHVGTMTGDLCSFAMPL